MPFCFQFLYLSDFINKVILRCYILQDIICDTHIQKCTNKNYMYEAKFGIGMPVTL